MTDELERCHKNIVAVPSDRDSDGANLLKIQHNMMVIFKYGTMY